MGPPVPMLRTFVTLCLLGLASPAFALDASVWAELGRVKSLRAEFVQVQTRKILKKPLESRGTIEFDRPSALVWSVLAPYRSTFSLRGSRAVMDVPDVGTHEEIDLAAVPDANRLATSLMVWLQADAAAVARDFEATFTDSPPSVRLVPRDATLGKLVQALTIGLAPAPWRVARVVITEPTGDVVELRFTAVQLDGVRVPDPTP